MYYKSLKTMINLLGEEFEREIPVLEDNIILDEGNSVETHNQFQK